MLGASRVFAASPTPTATPYNLEAVFGSPYVPPPTPEACKFVSTYPGDCTVSSGQYAGQPCITANGIDPVTTALETASGVAINSANVSVTSSGGVNFYKAVAWPQTVVSSVPGAWTVTVIGAYSCAVTLIAQ